MTERVLVIGPAWIGDMVMAQAMFEQLQQERGCQIDVLAPAWCRPLLARMPQVSRALDWPFAHGELRLSARLGFGRSLRSAQYTQAIVLPNSFKSALPLLTAAIARRTGWRGEARGLLLNDCRRLDRQRYPLMVQRFVALALAPDQPLPVPFPRPQLRVDPLQLEAAVTQFGISLDRPLLAFCPGAEFGDAKRWPPEHFARLGQWHIEQGWQVCLLGSAADSRITQTIRNAMPKALQLHCHDLAGATRLEQAIDLLSCAAMVVSNDSGLMHVAAALNRPLVAIYGSTTSDFTPPLADAVRILSSDISCRPCFKRQCPLKHKRCLTEISPEHVRASMISLAAELPSAEADAAPTALRGLLARLSKRSHAGHGS